MAEKKLNVEITSNLSNTTDYTSFTKKKFNVPPEVELKRSKREVRSLILMNENLNDTINEMDDETKTLGKLLATAYSDIERYKHDLKISQHHSNRNYALLRGIKKLCNDVKNSCKNSKKKSELEKFADRILDILEDM